MQALLEALCSGLTQLGVHLFSVTISTSLVHPEIRGLGLTWTRCNGATLTVAPHSHETEAAYQQSFLHAMNVSLRTSGRWRLDDTARCVAHGDMARLRSEGCTELIFKVIDFTPGTALYGAAIQIATDAPNGFEETHAGMIDALLPTLGLALCKMQTARTLHKALATYLGPGPGARVLNGEAQRGQGVQIEPAIMVADLRGFTAVTERHDPMQVVEWLNEHFDAIGDPIERHGGEILKFTGDGLIAIFPEIETLDGLDCEPALLAAEEALYRNGRLNERRRAANCPALDVGFALHVGQVVYGNVGTARRLDFTVTGQAVNEASRMEKLCGTMNYPILISDSFSARCSRLLSPVGIVQLRGINSARALWTTFEHGVQPSEQS